MIRSNKIWWILFSTLTIVVYFLMNVRINEGLTFTNLSNIVGWGLWVTFYVYFLGISVGLFLIYGIYIIFDLKKFRNVGLVALYSSLVTLIVGLFFILIDIGHLGRFWTVFINRNINSILSWELHLYILYLFTISTLLIFENFKSIEKFIKKSKLKTWVNKYKDKIIQYITYFGVPLAIAVHGGTGALFAVIEARVIWNSAIFPIIFLISAILSGIAAIIILMGIFKRMYVSAKELKQLSRIFIFVVFIDSVLVLGFLFLHYISDINESMAYINLLLYEDYSNSFWIGQIGIGVILTVLFYIKYSFHSKRKFLYLWLSAFSCIIGIWFIRMNFIAPTLSVPLIEGLSENIYRSSDHLKYQPSMMEWIYSLLIIVSGTIVYIFGSYHIPAINEASHSTKKRDVDK